MGYQMTSRERITRMFEHKDADRTPIVDLPWDSPIARWHREGLPAGADWAEYLDVDVYREFVARAKELGRYDSTHSELIYDIPRMGASASWR